MGDMRIPSCKIVELLPSSCGIGIVDIKKLRDPTSDLHIQEKGFTDLYSDNVGLGPHVGLHVHNPLGDGVLLTGKQ